MFHDLAVIVFMYDNIWEIIEHLLKHTRLADTAFPDKRKAQAVKNAIEGEITENCPASVLRNHPSVDLYLDPPAASLLSF